MSCAGEMGGGRRGWGKVVGWGHRWCPFSCCYAQARCGCLLVWHWQAGEAGRTGRRQVSGSESFAVSLFSAEEPAAAGGGASLSAAAVGSARDPGGLKTD